MSRAASIVYRLLKPLLFLLPAETAHHLMMGVLGLVSKLPFLLWLLRKLYVFQDEALHTDTMGLHFDNPIGLAAGLDKDARAFRALGALGFGLVEVGTLTGEAQPGNDRPRLFRLERDRALINRMGFNNSGALDAASRIRRRRADRVRLGANIGRTKRVANDEAVADYIKSTRALAPDVDYLVINVSSPNTPGLRALQDKSALTPLLAAIRQTLDETVPERRVPLLVKVAPDLADEDIDAVAEVALELGLDGIIATNTTIARDGLHTPEEQVRSLGAGGLSGPPVAERSLYVLRRLRRKVGNRVTLIASGGIQNGDEVFERIRAGASLVQVYTALIYEGPQLPGRLARQLRQRLHDAGYANVADAVGADADCS